MLRLRSGNEVTTDKMSTLTENRCARLRRTIKRSLLVDSYIKWPEILKCKRPISMVSINFLHGIFARLGVPDTTFQITKHNSQLVNLGFSVNHYQ